MSEREALQRSAPVWRAVWACWMVGWYLKTPYWWRALDTAQTYRVRHELFPEVMRAPWLLAAALLLPLLTLPLILRPTRRRLLAAAALQLTAATVALGHLLAFFDATFTTSWWVALWLLWLATQCERDDDDLPREAQLLAKTTVAMIFFGGAIGKLTPEHWSGEVFYRVYFLQKPYSPYVWLRAQLDPATLRALATWFARVVTLIEWLIALSWPLPYRWYAWPVVAFLACMVLGSTPWLASVLLCLGGLLVVNGWWWPHPRDALASPPLSRRLPSPGFLFNPERGDSPS